MFTAGLYDDLKDLYDNHCTKPCANCSMFCIFYLKGHFWVLSSAFNLAPVYFTSYCFCLATVVLMPFHFTSI